MLRTADKRLFVGDRLPSILSAYSGVVPPVPGYVVWLDAAYVPSVTLVEGRVSQWNDLSGNGNHFTQATAILQPTYGRQIGGVAAVGFNGGDQYLDSSLTSSDNTVSRFIVARCFRVNVQQYLLGSNGGTGGIGLRLAADADMETTTDGVTTQFSPTTLDITADQAFVFGQIIGGATNIVHHRNSGSDSSAAAISPTAGRGTRLGASSALTQYLYGDVGELLVYDSALSSGNALEVMNYLQNKWSIT